MRPTPTSYEEAVVTYLGAAQDRASQPGKIDSQYDEDRGGWRLANVYGPLALVRDDGTIVDPVYDDDAHAWVIPED